MNKIDFLIIAIMVGIIVYLGYIDIKLDKIQASLNEPIILINK